MTARVFIVDLHPVIREGLARMLTETGDFQVAGMADSGREIVRAARQSRCHVVIMDMAVAGLSGLDVARQLGDLRPAPQLIVFSAADTPESVCYALQAGARGYVLKTAATGEIVDAVRAVLSGRRYLSRDLPRRLHKDFLAGRVRPTSLERLSGRERQILQLVVQGGTSAAIAQRLALSLKTVETYRSRATRKLGVRGMPALVRFCIRYGITPL